MDFNAIGNGLGSQATKGVVEVEYGDSILTASSVANNTLGEE